MRISAERKRPTDSRTETIYADGEVVTTTESGVFFRANDGEERYFPFDVWYVVLAND